MKTRLRALVLTFLALMLVAFAHAPLRATVLLAATESGSERMFETEVHAVQLPVTRGIELRFGRKPHEQTEIPSAAPSLAYARPFPTSPRRAAGPRAPPHQPRAPPVVA